MRILVTNDDGIDSIGLHILARAMRPFGDVMIVAPDREFSGASVAVGALHDLRPEARVAHVDGIDEAWCVNGPPALCVMFARLGAFGAAFDLEVSGINPGANVGRAVYHSGTVGACIAARNGGISGVAVSQAVDGLGVEGQAWDEMLVGLRWDTAAAVTASYVEGLVQQLPANPVVVNLNVPNLELAELSGWRVAEIGHTVPQQVSTAELIPKVGFPNAFDVDVRWAPAGDLQPDSEAGLLAGGFVTVSYVSRYTNEHRPDLAAVEATFLGG